MKSDAAARSGLASLCPPTLVAVGASLVVGGPIWKHVFVYCILMAAYGMGRLDG